MIRDYFIYNGQDIVPEYLPGVPSYGQEGAEGNTGETGPSIHYSSYNVEDNKTTCENLINSGKALSNNLDEIEDPAYLEGDFIIDCVGNLWKIQEESFTGSFYIESANTLYSAGGNAFLDFQVSCITTYNKRSTITNVADNEYYLNEYDQVSSSPKMYHRQRYEKYAYGNWLLFKVTLNSGFNSADFYYKYVLLLPNGEQLTVVSDETYATMFIDNSLLYTFSLDYDYSKTNYLSPAYKRIDPNFVNYVSKCIPSGDYEYKITEHASTLDNVPQYVLPNNIPSDLKGMINFSGISRNTMGEEGEELIARNNEHNKFVALTMSRYLTDFCTAYVEVYHRQTGKSYRLDLDDIYLMSSTNENTGETNYNEYTSHIDEITPVVPLMEWAIHNYSQGFLIDSSADSSVAARFRRMDSYMLFTDMKNNSSSEDEKQQDFYYIDVTGIQHDYDGSNPSYPDGGYYPESWGRLATESGYNYIQNIPGDCPRTIRLKFMNTRSLSITIEYNRVEILNLDTNEHIVTDPFTMIYIGLPDCDLISYGNNIKIDEEHYVDKGIYYLHRFIPNINNVMYDANMFSYAGIGENNTELVNVGKAIFNIDLAEFNLNPNKMHFIEIGAVPIGQWNIKNENLPQDIYDVNVFHRWVVHNDTLCSFANNSENASGNSDFTLYVNTIEGVTEETSYIDNSNTNYVFSKGQLDTIIDPETGLSTLTIEKYD